MALVASANGAATNWSQIQQFINLLTGVMTDQPVYIQNTIRSSSTGATAAAYFAGGTTTGAPTTGTHAVGEAVIAQDGFWWICTAAGTPGTWKLAGAALETATPAAPTSAGVVGTSLNAAHGDHSHPWTPLGVLANANAWSALNTFSSGISVSGGDASVAGRILMTAATSKLVPGATGWSIRDHADANDNLSGTDAGNVTIRGTATIGGAAALNGGGTVASGQLLKGYTGPSTNVGPYRYSVSFGDQCRTLFNAGTRNDTYVQEGDVLFNV